jgi:hypothetical protein
MTPKKSKLCPECGMALAERLKACQCGWQQPIEPCTTVNDHRCEYRLDNRRCPLPGGVCAYVKANGPWYCKEHLRTLDDPKLAEAVLRHAEENYESIIAQRDWRKVALECATSHSLDINTLNSVVFPQRLRQLIQSKLLNIASSDKNNSGSLV